MAHQETIEGKNVCLRPLAREDLNDVYLGWLNDPVTNQFSRRRYKKTSREEMFDYFEKFDRENGAFFAIIDKALNKHIGNITISNVDKIQQTGELAILVGNRESQGKGLGKEAWHLMTKYGFEVLCLRKLVAGTVNPAMEKILESQGWAKEGTLREAFLVDGKYLDEKVFGIFKSEFQSKNKNI